MTRTSGQDAAWVMGRLDCGCGYGGYVDWSHDPEVDRTSLYATCPDCDAEAIKPTSEGMY